MTYTCQVTKSISEEPVANIVDGWVLKNGQLYLCVKCEDGVYRWIIIDRKRP